MADKKSIWYHIGHALERARGAAPARRALPGLAERREETAPERTHGKSSVPSADELVTAGMAVVVDRVLATWTGRSSPGFARLLRAGASGAAAALLVDLVRPLITGDARTPSIDRHTADRMLAGVGQGLVYGAIVEPRVPGPSVLRGALYGSAEYLSDPLGGLSAILGGHAPQHHLPILGEIMDELDDHERAYLEHVVFGIVVALLYESGSASSGMEPDEE